MALSTPDIGGAVPDLSVVIPVYNAADSLDGLVRGVLSTTQHKVEVLLVDDASTDESVAVMRGFDDPAVRIIELPENRGAGAARNVGFTKATGRYTLFFDADDEIEPTAVSSAIEHLDTSGADVAFLPYRYRRGDQPSVQSMNHFDRIVWDEYICDVDHRVVKLREAPRLLGFSNYPWNKIIRTDHYQQMGLRFGETRVHNDILGHWSTLLRARSIVLLNQVIGTHVVETNGKNLSHQHDRCRLELFEALDETYDLLDSIPGVRSRYAHHYWDFVIRVADWAKSRLDPALREEAAELLQAHLFRMNIADFAHMRLRRNPNLADVVVRRALT